MNVPTDETLSAAAAREYAAAVCSSRYLDELLDVLREAVGSDLPHYSESLRKAFARIDPVFVRPRYAEFFWHCASRVPGYLPRVVLTNGKAESEGSVKLFELWQRVKDTPEVEKQVMTHAADESRHARIFVRLTELAFPGHFSDFAIARFEESLPDVRKVRPEKSAEMIPENHVIDHLVQMNIGEIRTRLHMHLFAPVVCGMSAESGRVAVRALFKGLVRDEVRHISYTAQLMEQWAQDGAGKLISDLYAGRLHAFNHITYQQTSAAVSDYGQGRFPELMEI
ncbi:MAG TPA: hypothetical protein VHU83_11735 [Bryobacteraceae bacterium]|nr:hypothetical protein [Bryobacteraceae bacterium]